MNEFSLIEKYFSPLSAKFSGALGLKDDAAIITPDENSEIVITKDSIVADVHFHKNESPYNIAQKLVGVNYSDLAAMGAKPIAFFISAVLPKNVDEAWFESFSTGLKDASEKYGGHLAGGDTVTHDGAITLSLTAIGSAPKGKSMLRSKANIGDDIYVTGTIGDSYLGLKSINGEIAKTDYLEDRYRTPQPRVQLGILLNEFVKCATDISDGLVSDAGHIASASGVLMSIEADNVPQSDAAKNIANIDIVDLITGGDDYELLFTCPPEFADAIANISQGLSLPIAKIGSVKKGKGVDILDKSGNKLIINKTGYNHF